MNAGASCGRMPAKVSVSERAIVTAGFANDVDGVNQYAPTMYAATAYGVAAERARTQPQITASSPNVATNSLTNIPGPERACPEMENSGKPNMPFASAVPHNAPAIWATTYGTTDATAGRLATRRPRSPPD